VELATANGERRRKKMEERQGEEMEGVGSRRGWRGVSTLRARHGFDAWRPRGVLALRAVGHGRRA
jgi:hypothetical protein